VGSPGDVYRVIIDTHVDFTAEAERSLRVLDGGVVVFSDAVAGTSRSLERFGGRPTNIVNPDLLRCQ